MLTSWSTDRLAKLYSDNSPLTWRLPLLTIWTNVWLDPVVDFETSRLTSTTVPSTVLNTVVASSKSFELLTLSAASARLSCKSFNWESKDCCVLTAGAVLSPDSSPSAVGLGVGAVPLFWSS